MRGGEASEGGAGMGVRRPQSRVLGPRGRAGRKGPPGLQREAALPTPQLWTSAQARGEQLLLYSAPSCARDRHVEPAGIQSPDAVLQGVPAASAEPEQTRTGPVLTKACSGGPETAAPSLAARGWAVTSGERGCQETGIFHDVFT